MIDRDLCNYSKNNWQHFICTIAEISKNSNNGSIVKSEKKIYNFDKITKNLYSNGNCPASADGLDITNKIFELIEFKSGFKKRISKKNFDYEKAKCEHLGDLCRHYWDLFYKNQENETKQLIASIKFKAIESYIVLEKKIFPCCNMLKDNNKAKVKLTIVIDEDELDNMEDTLAELSGQSAEPNNCYGQIKQALKRMQNQTDALGNDYFYDNINVLSAEDFYNQIEKT